MHRYIRAVVVALFCICFQTEAKAAGEGPDQPARILKREVLALFDGGQEGSVAGTRLHRFAELPLNHLGYILRYRDVREELPKPDEMASYAAVVTWFVGPVVHGDRYLGWLHQAASRNARLLVLGDLGVTITQANRQLANGILRLFGLRHTGDYILSTDGSRVVGRDAGLYEFECALDPVLQPYPILERIAADARTGVEV